MPNLLKLGGMLSHAHSSQVILLLFLSVTSSQLIEKSPGLHEQRNNINVIFRNGLQHFRNLPDPEKWPVIYPSWCGGDSQSPISLDPGTALTVHYPSFTFVNYAQVRRMKMTNNGYTVVYGLEGQDLTERSSSRLNKVPFVEGGGLSGRYLFAQFHLHWGNWPVEDGSEHLLDSKRYPAELHVVHYNAKYGTFAEATNHPDGLAVLAVFIAVGCEENKAFQTVVQQLGQVAKSGQEATLSHPVLLKGLLPSDASSFYRYQGSLTTPFCQEIVTWTVFDNPVSVSKKQLRKLRNLLNNRNEVLINNYRPAQESNDRLLTYRPSSRTHPSYQFNKMDAL